ncbi:hypothetical protein BGZ63DRAFT_274435 [Mariannaea sp. PMI_226]|nr:hypothetical protein BGZ63DRAFT_274435 [Mariannaea sp. PMI_226]
MPTPAGPGLPPSGSCSTNLNHKTLEMIVREHLDSLAEQIPSAMTHDPRGPRQEVTLPRDIGDYLRSSAQTWAEMTEILVKCKQLDQAANTLALDSYQKTRAADINIVTIAMEGDLHKLMKIREATNRFSQDVRAIWDEPPRTGN